MSVSVLAVIGTRPEAVKMAPVVMALQRHAEFTVKIVLTAQHREMLDQVMRQFGLAGDRDLDIMQPRQSLTDITVRALGGLEGVYAECRPDIVLAQGDTTTVFVAALAAYYARLPFGHVEAGLRTGDKFSPYPEEMNRRLASVLADLHFAPTAAARDNLLAERVPPERIFVTGNTVIDALLWAAARGALPAELAWAEALPGPLILVTAHRRESFGEGFENMCRALKEIALKNPDVQIVYPVHLNPNVQEPVRRIMGGVDRIHLIEPIEYEPFVYLMNQSFFILTDSGGIQEEAPSLGKPVLVMREVTERPEAMEAGTARLVGSGREGIVREAQKLLEDPAEYGRMANKQNPYGDGRASERIADLLTGVIAR